MFFIRGFATDLVLRYLAAFILLTGLLSTDAVPILRRSPRPNSYRHSDNENTLSFHNAPRALHAQEAHRVRSDIAPLGERSLVKRGNCFSSNSGGSGSGNTNTWQCSRQPPTVAECVSQHACNTTHAIPSSATSSCGTTSSTTTGTWPKHKPSARRTLAP